MASADRLGRTTPTVGAGNVVLSLPRALPAELAIDAMKQDYKRMQEDIQAQQAQVELDQANFDRYAVLVRSDSISKANYDQARFALAVDKRNL